MFGSNILDVALGLALVYLLMSLATSAVRETLAGIWKTRAKYLERGIQELLHNDPAFLKDFYEHPQIYPLYEGGDSRPSYIPARNFAMALLDMAARGRNSQLASQAGAESTALTSENVRRYVAGLRNVKVQRMVLSAIETSHGDLARAQQSLEAWFDSAMDRVSGRYRRRTSWVLFAIGAIVTVLLNVDTIRVGTAFYRSPALREAAVAMAGRATDARAAGDSTGGISTATVNPALDSLYALRLPIGWKGVVAGHWPVGAEWKAVGDTAVGSFFGWLLTAFALSLGAPFWFDMLNRIMVIRSTVKPREKSPEEPSEDRQKPSGGSYGSASLVEPVPPPPAPPPSVVVITQGTASSGLATGGIAGVGGMGRSENSHEWSSGDPEGGLV